MKLLVFHADWCKTCVQQDNELTEHQPLCEVVKMDINNERMMKFMKDFKVYDIPTLMLMKDFSIDDQSTWSEDNILERFVDFTETEKINESITKN